MAEINKRTVSYIGNAKKIICFDWFDRWLIHQETNNIIYRYIDVIWMKTRYSNHQKTSFGWLGDQFADWQNKRYSKGKWSLIHTHSRSFAHTPPRGEFLSNQEHPMDECGELSFLFDIFLNNAFTNIGLFLIGNFDFMSINQVALKYGQRLMFFFFQIYR